MPLLIRQVLSTIRLWQWGMLQPYTWVVGNMQTKERWHEAVACRIRALRKAAGLTQEQLSEKADIAPQHLSRLETGRQAPSLDTLVDIAAALDTTPSALLMEPQEDDHAELLSRVAAMCRTLTKEEAAFLESQLAGWMSYMKKRPS